MVAPVTFESFQAELAHLVSRFEREHPHFTNADYNEAMVRADFLDPFFRSLGWDVGNATPEEIALVEGTAAPVETAE